jgi:hypothetical protein
VGATQNLSRLLRSSTRAEERIGQRIELTVAGKRGGFPTYIAEVEALLSKMPNVAVIGNVSDEVLTALYDSQHVSVYPSVEEGFGSQFWLPTPCLCHNASSMAEMAPGGGTIAIDMIDEEAICGALCRLAEEVDLFPKLAGEIVVRPLKTWAAHGQAIASSLKKQSNQPTRTSGTAKAPLPPDAPQAIAHVDLDELASMRR